MKPLLSLLMILLAGTACTTAQDPDEDPWTWLFDGASMEEWTPKIRGYAAGEDPQETFRLDPNTGHIQVRYDRYDQFDETFGHLFHRNRYASYYLEMEYRFVGEQVSDGPGWAWRNSGIMFHSQSPESMELDQDFPDSIELQLLGTVPGQSRTNANLCTPGTHVMMGLEQITQHCTESVSRSYLDDEWVTVGLFVHADRWIEHHLEGESVLSYHTPHLDDGTRLTGGYIAIQSESHPLDVRSVRIRPLTPEEIHHAEEQYRLANRTMEEDS